MRILHIIGTMNPAAGGPTESVRVLLTFGPIGYTGEVVTLDSPSAPYLQHLPFAIHALGPQATKYGFNWKLYRWLRANRERFDGVVVNGVWQFCGLAAWMALRDRTPYVVFTHGMLDPWFKQKYPLKHIKKWCYWLVAEYWILRRAYRVLFTSQEESRLAATSFSLHRWKGLVVPYGASHAPVSRSTSVEAFYAACEECRGHRLVLFLGRIHQKKGCDHLIQAFAEVASLDHDVHLVVAGPDQQGWADELRRLAERSGVGQRVHWPGMLHGEAKWGALFASDVFILPSHQENFGIAVAEALACGCPVLLSHKVNIAGEIARAGAGFVDDDSAIGTERLLRRWLALSDEERKAMGVRAKACFANHFDMRKNAETIIRLFECAAVPERI